MSWGSDILFDAGKDAGWQWVTRYTLKHSDWLFCDCDAVKDAVRRMVAYPDERILKIPWGIDLKTLHSGKTTGSIREELGWSASFIVLSTRMWEDLYGIDTLLSAFTTAYRRNPALRLLLPGDGSRAQHIRKFIHDHGLNEVIHMPGVIANDRIPDYFSASDLYVSCSFSDGTSVSLLEAMGHGLPVLVSDIPGNREWVVHNENGWLAEAGNGQAFSEGVVTASRLNEKKRKEISEKNRAIIETRADWDKNSHQLLHLYDAIEAAHD
jgi:glycosyltransferase involved in cell wall biosynthesis